MPNGHPLCILSQSPPHLNDAVICESISLVDMKREMRLASVFVDDFADHFAPSANYFRLGLPHWVFKHHRKELEFLGQIIL